MAEDWHDSLRTLLGGNTLPIEDSAEESSDIKKLGQKERLDIIVERKGRGGKVATIVAGFTIDDNEVAEIATRLKRKLGTGGSARDGEILIQGDRARSVQEALGAMGFKSRII